MERDILRHHCLWQKSWTGPPSLAGSPPLTSFAWNLTSRDSSSSRTSNLSKSSKIKKQTGISTSDSGIRRWKSVPDYIGQPDADAGKPLSIAEILDNRRQNRIYRRKPWTEKVTIKHNSSKYIKEFYYGSVLPSDIIDAKRRTRKYVTNSKYGDIYEVRFEADSKKKKEIRPFSRWLWEDEFQLWTTENGIGNQHYGYASLLERTSPVRSKTPTTPSPVHNSRNSHTSRSVTPTGSRGQTSPRKKAAPNPNLYADYHSHRLQHRRRTDAARLIQAVFRGWYIRRFLQNLKRKVQLEHLTSWGRCVSEYKDLVRRVQERYGVKRPSCRLDLKELHAFLDSKLKYEQTFRKLAYGDRLLKSDLPQFFTACDLHPTEGEIQQAFEKVFKGGNNTAEVIFLLDCSTSVTPMCFHYLTEFVKSVVESFTIGPDNIRVGVVPFSDDVYQAFGINRYNMTYQICAAIDNIGHKEGLTRTDLALKEMKKLFMCSRPGVQKIAIIITDGKSTCPERTLQNARDVKEDNINVITIGMGSHVDLEELKHIASSEKNVFSVYDYSSLYKLRDVISRRTCLAACVLCQTILPRIRDHGLYLREVLELVWTLYTPIGCEISWYTEVDYGTITNAIPHHSECLPTPNSTRVEHPSKNKNKDMSRPNFGESCRPLEQREVLEVLWTTYPPAATQLNVRSSRWLRPRSKGTEAWSLLDDKVKKSTDINTCLRLVIQTKIEREGFITLPSDVREGVEQVSDPDLALEKVNKWIKEKKRVGETFQGFS